VAPPLPVDPPVSPLPPLPEEPPEPLPPPDAPGLPPEAPPLLPPLAPPDGEPPLPLLLPPVPGAPPLLPPLSPVSFWAGVQAKVPTTTKRETSDAPSEGRRREWERVWGILPGSGPMWSKPSPVPAFAPS
jgi:hypothetical protein